MEATRSEAKAKRRLGYVECLWFLGRAGGGASVRFVCSNTANCVAGAKVSSDEEDNGGGDGDDGYDDDIEMIG